MYTNENLEELVNLELGHMVGIVTNRRHGIRTKQRRLLKLKLCLI